MGAHSFSSTGIPPLPGGSVCLAPARDAEPMPPFPANIRGIRNVMQPLLTDPSPPGAHAPPNVFLSGDWLKMSGIYAGVDSTKVVKNEALGDGTDQRYIDELMCHRGPMDLLVTRRAISSDVQSSSPNPTAIPLDPVTRQPVNPGPRPLGRRSMTLPSRIMLGTESLNQFARGVAIRFRRVASCGHDHTVTGQGVIGHG
jgi:hypothetical protein